MGGQGQGGWGATGTRDHEIPQRAMNRHTKKLGVERSQPYYCNFKDKPTGYRKPLGIAPARNKLLNDFVGVLKAAFFLAEKPTLLQKRTFIPCQYRSVSMCINYENEWFQVAGFTFVHSRPYTSLQKLPTVCFIRPLCLPPSVGVFAPIKMPSQWQPPYNYMYNNMLNAQEIASLQLV